MFNFLRRFCIASCFVFVVLLASMAHAQSLTSYSHTYGSAYVDEYNSGYKSTASYDPVHINSRSVPDVARAHWKIANKYKAERRYELARQHYLMALAHSNTAALRDTLQKELQVVELLIRTLR